MSISTYSNRKFKLEDWRVGLDYFRKGCYFTKFDLKAVIIIWMFFPKHQLYLDFSWVIPDGDTKFHVYCSPLWTIVGSLYIHKAL